MKTFNKKMESVTIENEKEMETVKKQKVSISYLLRSTKENIEKLKDQELITEEEYKTMTSIRVKAMHKWMGE